MDLKAGTFKVRSWFDAVNIKDVAEGVWEVTKNGVRVASGSLPDLDVAPRQEREFSLALPALAAEPGAEYWLNVSFRLKGDARWAKKGHEVAWEQWKLPVDAPAAAPAASSKRPLRIAQGSPYVRIGGRDFALVFDRLNGYLVSYSYKGAPMIDRGPVPEFWRAMTDNDIGAWKSVGNRARTDPAQDILVWREAGASWKVTEVQVSRVDESTATIVVRGALPLVDAKYAATYTIREDGELTVKAEYQPGAKPLAMMPRFGMELVVAPGFERMTWYGRGPGRDLRRSRVRAGRRVLVDGRRRVGGVLEAAGQRQQGRRAMGGADQRRRGSACESRGCRSSASRRITPAGGRSSRRPTRIRSPSGRRSTSTVDFMQMGVGGIDSWSRQAYPMEPYRIPADKPYAYSFRLRPIERR